MDRDDDFFSKRRLQRLPPRFGHPHLSAHDRACRCCAKAKNHLRLNRRQLSFEPGKARIDLALCRCFVQPASTTRLPLEVFHRVRDVHILTRNTRRFERLVEDLTRRSDKRVPFDILTVARLLPDDE